MVALQDSHFALFGLPARFALDAPALDRAYRAVQAQVHPDRFAAAGAAQKRVAMQWATRANEAYQTLRDPLRRAVYLLQLRGIDASAHHATALAPAFLMQQMTWRERIEEAVAAKNVDALDALASALRADARARLERLAALLDGDATANATDADAADTGNDDGAHAGDGSGSNDGNGNSANEGRNASDGNSNGANEGRNASDDNSNGNGDSSNGGMSNDMAARHAIQTAATLVRELMFIDKVAKEARAQTERLEGSTDTFAA